jgi:hypothetical protein
MKSIIAASVLAVAIASPALAQSQMWEPAPGQAFARSWQGTVDNPLSAYAQQGGIRDPRQHLGNPAYSVYDSRGEYVGADPDPFIRNDLARDPPNRNDD